MSEIRFIQARNFTRTTGRTIDYLVEHDMEYPERLTAAEDVASYFANQKAHNPAAGVYGSSAHFNVDADSIVQSVLVKDVAWAAPGANSDGIQIEHAGYARQTRAEWLDDFGKKMLALSIELQARLAEEYAIPIVRRRPADLLKGLRGITGHVDVSLAFRRSDHTDPGSSFPWDHFLAGVKEAMRPDHKPEPKKEFVALVLGDKGWRVKKLQRLLDALPYIKVRDDGSFGERTEAAVKQFQRRAGIKATGRVGEPTWKALLLAQKGGS